MESEMIPTITLIAALALSFYAGMVVMGRIAANKIEYMRRDRAGLIAYTDFLLRRLSMGQRENEVQGIMDEMVKDLGKAE